MKFNYYQLYGLVVKTTNSIPHLISLTDSEQVDVNIQFEIVPTEKEFLFEHPATEVYASYGLAPNDIPYLTVYKQYASANNYLVIRYTNGKGTAYFVSDKKGEYIKVFYPDDIAVNDIYTYLLGPVIGCILRLKNKVLLHASVVNINNQAIAFIGEKTAGKSTLIATFGSLGYPILSDDIAVLFEKNGQYFIELGYPRLRLWKNTIDYLSGVDLTHLQRVLTHVDKYYLPLSEQPTTSWNFQSVPLPLSTIYYLPPRNEEHHLSIQPLKPLEAFLKLKQNIYAAYMLEDDLKNKEFDVLGTSANRGIVKLLNRPNRLDYLEATIDLIVRERL